MGVGIGLAVALVATRVLSALLYRISPFDPATFASVAVLLTLVALAASYAPARRAARIEPLNALRYE
jgi:ABC-type antimicrobial peptide transport system permease subunit